NGSFGSSFQDGGQLPIPKVHGGFLLGVIAVPVVHARYVILFRIIENPTDHESWHAAARHHARRCPAKVVPANVDFIPFAGYSLRPGENIRTCALCEAAPDVFVVTHE